MTGDIEIIGSTRDSVGTARRRIELIVLSSRSKQQSTHFLCVPITDQTIKANYNKFMVMEISQFPREARLNVFFSKKNFAERNPKWPIYLWLG